jgi:hypothetical protein
MAGNRTTERSADMSLRLTREKAVFRASLMINESWILKKNLQYDELNSTLMASCSGKNLMDTTFLIPVILYSRQRSRFAYRV